MHTLGYYLGIPKQTEVIIFTLIGICCTIFDASLLDLNSNLHKVWNLTLNLEHFSGSSQVFIKYLLSAIVLVRSFTVHLYLAFYIVMLWPAIFEDRPALLLPWLIVGLIKCLLTGLMTLCIGMYTCLACGMFRPACWDFFLSQIVENAPSFYMWLCILSFYQDLKLCVPSAPAEPVKPNISELTIRRRKVRSMADGNLMYTPYFCEIEEDRHLISVSTIVNIVQQLTTDFHKKTTRSLDSLLGFMTVEAEKEELMHLYKDAHSDDAGLTIQQKTVKALKLTEKDIEKAKLKKSQGHDKLFTNSMLNLQKLGKTQPFARVKEKLLPHRTKTMRPIYSEKVFPKSSNNSKCPLVADNMSDMSEIQIAPVLNYSSTSVDYNPSMSKNVGTLVKKMAVEGKKSLIPLRASRPVLAKLTKPKKEPVVKEFEVIEKTSRTSDFTCQASTLSRNILKSPPLELTRFMRRKNPLKKCPEKIPEVKTALNSKKMKKIIENNVDPQYFEQNSLFRNDAYDLSYLTKMQRTADES